jgi:hypothetical protein
MICIIASNILQILEAQDKVAEKTQIYLPYNILPLDPDSANQAIMRYPEVSSLCALSLFTYNLAVSLLPLAMFIFCWHTDPSCCCCSA